MVFMCTGLIFLLDGILPTPSHATPVCNVYACPGGVCSVDVAYKYDCVPSSCQDVCGGSASSQAECGNGERDAGEECDDDNTNDGDGCAANCSIEAEYCGDGMCTGTEDCDTCSDDCGICESCGDGEIQAGMGEECEIDTTAPNGNSFNCEANETCDAYCHCVPEPSTCGNTTVETDEECDDGNTTNGDGCTAQCKKEMSCAVCYFDELQVASCGAKTIEQCGKTACNDGIDNDGDGKKDFPEDMGCVATNDDSEGLDFIGNDCRVFEGACKTRFEVECKEWLASKTSVEEANRFLVAESDPPPTALDKCTSLDFMRKGHGRGCYQFAQLVNGCVKNCSPEFGAIVCKDDGCNVFQNKDSVAFWTDWLQQSLKPGQTIEMKASQVARGNDCSASDITYKIDALIKEKTCSPCHGSGFCFPEEGSPATECSAKGDLKCDGQQVCCRVAGTATGDWRTGNKCNYADVNVSATAETGWYYFSGFTSNGAVEAAEGAARNVNRQSCSAMPGTFSDGPPCSTTIHGVGPFACYVSTICQDVCKDVLQ